jgi:hypothetical protein
MNPLTADDPTDFPPHSAATCRRSEASGFTWRPTQSTQSTVTEMVKRLAVSTPINDALLELARNEKHRPPQRWYQEDTDPFKPELG